MPQWRFQTTQEAEEDLARLDPQIRKRVVEKLQWLIDNFDHVIPLPLGGEWRGFFKLRVGDWRIIYEVEAQETKVTVHEIDRRDKIYKRRT